MMNFWEANYDNFEIIHESRIKPRFYYVLNSSWNKNEFDPLKRFDLVHFLLIGYDSYLELLANRHFITKVPT
jgi:hypothetical protein